MTPSSRPSSAARALVPKDDREVQELERRVSDAEVEASPDQEEVAGLNSVPSKALLANTRVSAEIMRKHRRRMEQYFDGADKDEG